MFVQLHYLLNFLFQLRSKESWLKRGGCNGAIKDCGMECWRCKRAAGGHNQPTRERRGRLFLFLQQSPTQILPFIQSIHDWKEEFDWLVSFLLFKEDEPLPPQANSPISFHFWLNNLIEFISINIIKVTNEKKLIELSEMKWN